jgi:MraZ protein
VYVGKHRHTVDEKLRLKLPSQFRDSISGDKLIIAKGSGVPCLTVYTETAWNEFIEPIRKQAAYDYNYQRYLRMLASEAVSIRIDTQNRIMLPRDLMETVGITKDVIVVGVYSTFELWEPAQYDKEIQEVSEKEPEFLNYRVRQEHSS